MYRIFPKRVEEAAFFGGNRYLVPWSRGIATTSLRTGLAMTAFFQTPIYPFLSSLLVHFQGQAVGVVEEGESSSVVGIGAHRLRLDPPRVQPVHRQFHVLHPEGQVPQSQGLGLGGPLGVTECGCDC